MASTHRRGPGGPHLPGHRRPTRPPPGRSATSRSDDEPDLLRDVASMLEESGPWRLLGFASSLLAVVDPRQTDPFAGPDDGPPDGLTLGGLVGTFLEVDQVETTALLTALVDLLPEDTDEVLVRRVRRELARRKHRLPRWLRPLAPLEVSEALVMGHVLGDGDNVMLDVRTASGDPLTAVIYIDHNLGTLVKDAFVLDAPLDQVAGRFREIAADEPDTTFEELHLADARARVEEAIELAAITYPPFETDTWPASRPLIERLLRALPEGGTGHVRPDWSEADREALLERFLASPHGRAHDDEDGRDLLESLLWFACDYGPGDPMRWSPVAVEILLADWLPRKVVAPFDHLAKAPDLLRDLIRFCHAERDLRHELTADTLAAVDEWEADYLDTIGDPDRPQGVAALFSGLLGGDLAAFDHGGWVRDMLHAAVGGPEALSELDDTPLPDEPFAWDAIPPDVHPRVSEVLDLTDGCCDELFDVEHRTAVRRLLADVTGGDPDIFRRRGRSDTAAAALMWAVARANSSLDASPGGLTAKALHAWFGLTGSASQRAGTMLRAIDVDLRARVTVDVHLGSPRYLVSRRRRSLIQHRDRLAGG